MIIIKKIKLFCIHHAGGSSIAFNKWKNCLADKIEMCPIELAGRGRRMSEDFYKSLDEAIDDVYQFIMAESKDSKYAIYGHSMGAAIAYEVCCKIAENKDDNLVHLFLSGRECPTKVKENQAIYKLGEEEFKKEILKLGGTPKEVFENESLKEVFVPIIRSDYKNIETYEHKHKNTVLSIPITVFNGKDDDLTEDEINGWKKQTSKEFKRYDYDGGHFFLFEKSECVVDKINTILS